MLDVGEIKDRETRPLQRAIIDYLAAIPEIARWRTLTLAACAFPQSMQGFPGKTTSSTPRSDWVLWTRLHAMRDRLQRLPAFGDYCIQHPLLVSDFNPRVMQASATIRYTADEEWLLVRGEGLKAAEAGGYKQFLGLSQDLVARTEYSGPQHCVGCRMIYDKAQPDSGSTGNLTTWREIGTSHHITLAVEQIRSLSDAEEPGSQLA